MNDKTDKTETDTVSAPQVARYLRSQGSSIREISEAIGRSHSTVHVWCQKPSLLAPIISPNANVARKSLKDQLGNPLSLVNSEADFVCAYGKDLIRKTKGCDFRDPDTKELIEVKSFAVNPRQCLEMVQEFYEHRRKAVLGSVQDDVVLIFRLESILKIPNPDDPIVDGVPFSEKMPAPFVDRVTSIESLPDVVIQKR